MRKVIEERTHEYDEKGRCIHMVRNYQNDEFLETWFLYDRNGKLYVRTSSDGTINKYTYNKNGKLISAGNFEESEAFEYGKRGKLISSRKRILGLTPALPYTAPFLVLYSQQSMLKTGGILNTVYKDGKFLMLNANVSVIDNIYDEKERLLRSQIGLWYCNYEYDEKGCCSHSITSDGCETWYECNERGDVIKISIDIPSIGDLYDQLNEVFETPAESIEQ